VPRAKLAETIAHELLHARLNLLGRLSQNARFVLGLGQEEHDLIAQVGLAIGEHFRMEETAGHPVDPAKPSNVWGVVVFLPDGSVGIIQTLPDVDSDPTTRSP